MATNSVIGGNQDATAFGTEPAGADQGASSGDQTAQPAVDQSTAVPADTASQSATPVWDGSQFVLKYRGKQIVPETREQLINWAQYGYDANERKRLLDTRENEISSRLKAVTEYEQLDGLLKQRPDIQQAIQEVVEKMRDGQTQAAARQMDAEIPTEVQPYVNGLLQKIQGLEKQVNDIGGWKKSMDERTANAQVESEIADMKKNHGDQDWEAKDEDGFTLQKRILKHAVDNSFPSLEAAYRDYMWDSVHTAAKANALKAAEEARKSAAKAGIVGKGAVNAQPPAPPKKYNPVGKSWQQVQADALNEALGKVI